MNIFDLNATISRRIPNQSMEVNILSSRKLLAFTLTLALILAVSGSAFAAFPKGSNPVVSIVKNSSMAVVNIDVEKTQKRTMSPFPFDDDPFFKRFFGDAFKDFTRSVPMKRIFFSFFNFFQSF